MRVLFDGVRCDPRDPGPRWREIGRTAEQIAIVDDLYDMGPLAARFVRVSPLTGLDADAARALVALFDAA